MRRLVILSTIFCFAIQILSAQNKMPIIGVSASWGDSDTRVPKAYTESVMMAGGVAVVLPITLDKKIIEQQIAAIDALVLTGGSDLDPMLYGEEPIPALGVVYPDRDEYDMALIKAAVESGKPILGICRGLQGLNIFFGGTLYQDIPSTYGKSYLKHNQERDGKYGIHSIHIKDGSILKGVIGSDSIVVNSRHHQAINRLAIGFKVSAYAPDGIIEVIESVDKPIIAVQFHPEEMASKGNEQMLNIFKYLITLIK